MNFGAKYQSDTIQTIDDDRAFIVRGTLNKGIGN
jgi:hypothetical protein